MLQRRAGVARNAIGEALQAPVGDVADRLGDVANWIGRTAEESPGLVRGLAGIALGIGGVVAASVLAAGTRWVVLSLREGWRDVGRVVGWTRTRLLGLAAAGRVQAAVAGLGRFAGALGRLSGVTRLAAAVQWLWNAALWANPIGATVAAVVAGAALIGGAVYLVYRYWEPIKAFFGNLWGAVTAEFAPVVEAWSTVFTDFSWAGVGKAIVKTLVGGVVGSVSLLWDGVAWVFGKVGGALFPDSDAREGPLSRLTASGGAILRTIGDGVRRAGPDGLRRPLASRLAAAAAALTLTVAPPVVEPAAAVPSPVVTRPVVEPAAAVPSPVVTRPVVEPAAAVPSPVVTRPVVEPAAAVPSPVVTRPVVEPAAAVPSPVVTRPVVEPAAAVPSPVVTRPVVEPAAAVPCPWSPACRGCPRPW